MLRTRVLLGLGLCAVSLVLGGCCEPVPSWARTYGGWRDDAAYAVIQTSDGSLLLAGYRASDVYRRGDGEVLLVKTKQDGRQLWKRTYGLDRQDAAHALIETTDGGYVVAGITGGYGDIWEARALLLKVDPDGRELWARQFNAADDDQYYAYDVVEAADGGFVIAGHTATRLVAFPKLTPFLIKTDPDGNELWRTVFESDVNIAACALIACSDGSLVFAGTHTSTDADSNESDLYLAKTDAQGSLLWERVHDLTMRDEVCELIQTSDGGLVLAGSAYEGPIGKGWHDALLVKTNADGEILWVKTYGGPQADYAYDVIETSDGGFALAGATYASGAFENMLLLKTDSDGNELWRQAYGGEGSDTGRAVCETSNGDFIAAGSAYSYTCYWGDMFAVRTSPEGETLWQ